MRCANPWATAAILLATAVPVAAQQRDREIRAKVNYVYASQFGLGQYSIGGLDVGVYSLPLKFQFEDVLGDSDLRVDVPITYGSYSFSDSRVSQGSAVSAKVESNSLAVQPKLTLDIPLHEGLRVSPLVAWGIGFTFGTSGKLTVDGAAQPTDLGESAFYTYQAGVSSLYERPLGDFKLLYGMAFVWAGDSSLNDSDTEDYGTFYTGPELRHPLGFHIGDITPDVGVFFVYHYFTPELQFTRSGREDLDVQQIFETGLSLGSSTPMHLPYIGDRLDRFRVGASYLAASGFDAFRINFGFPF
jgi:hypothetical protein